MSPRLLDGICLLSCSAHLHVQVKQRCASGFLGKVSYRCSLLVAWRRKDYTGDDHWNIRLWWAALRRKSNAQLQHPTKDSRVWTAKRNKTDELRGSPSAPCDYGAAGVELRK